MSGDQSGDFGLHFVSRDSPPMSVYLQFLPQLPALPSRLSGISLRLGRRRAAHSWSVEGASRTVIGQWSSTSLAISVSVLTISVAMACAALTPFHGCDSGRRAAHRWVGVMVGSNYTQSAHVYARHGQCTHICVRHCLRGPLARRLLSTGGGQHFDEWGW